MSGAAVGGAEVYESKDKALGAMNYIPYPKKTSGT